MKRVARQAVATVAMGARLRSIVGAGQAVVLRYHRVSGSAEHPVPLAVTPEEFEAQLQFLRERCQVVSPRVIAECVAEERPLPPNAVAITFDDGYEDNFSVAFPLLKKYELPAGFFVTAGWMEENKMTWWDTLHEYMCKAVEEHAEPAGHEALPTPVAAALTSANLAAPGGRATIEQELVAALRGLNQPVAELEALVEQIAAVLGVGEADPTAYQPMNWMQVRLLHDGGMDIGSHTMSHARLTTLPVEQALEELEQSKKIIEKHLGEPIDLLAYPAGDYNQDVEDLAVEAGYEGAFTTVAGPVRPGDDAFALRRIGVWCGGYRGGFGKHFSPTVFGLQISRLARRT